MSRVVIIKWYDIIKAKGKREIIRIKGNKVENEHTKSFCGKQEYKLSTLLVQYNPIKKLEFSC